MPHRRTFSLDRLPPGRVATVAAIDWDHADRVTVRRLCEMGIDEGVDVELLHRGPVGGDPVAIRVGNVVLAMRRAQARLVTARLMTDEDDAKLEAAE